MMSYEQMIITQMRADHYAYLVPSAERCAYAAYQEYEKAKIWPDHWKEKVRPYFPSKSEVDEGNVWYEKVRAAREKYFEVLAELGRCEYRHQQAARIASHARAAHIALFSEYKDKAGIHCPQPDAYPTSVISEFAKVG